MGDIPDERDLEAFYEAHEDEYEALLEAEGWECTNAPVVPLAPKNTTAVTAKAPEKPLDVETISDDDDGLIEFNENRQPSPPDDLDIPEPLPSPEPSQQRPKRSLQELLDDVDALLARNGRQNDRLGSKRFRQEPETHEQQRVLEAIATLRSARKDAEEESSSLFDHSRRGRKNFAEPIIHDKLPNVENFCSVRNPYTKRNLYLIIRPEDAFETTKRPNFALSLNNLLEVPYVKLKEQAEKEREKRSKRNDEDEGLNHLIELREESVQPEEDSASSLWVDKYRPRGYMDLLSDEATNRTLLHWLRMWDKIVFGKELLKKKKPEPDLAQAGKFVPRGPVITFELDENGRPKQKVALLCGPPGMGKTTLAHTIAKHAGYNVVEVNASDDRSPEAFTSVLRSATEMRSVLGAEPKPNCLVIDEIDGAQAASINVLINFVTGKGGGKKGKKKGEEKTAFLKRPVICICNDAFVPALKPLKPHALIVNFPPTTSHRLAHRMLKIVRDQKLRADITTLMMLCEKAENDIRSCLSTLEFICSKKRNLDLRMSDIQQAAVGQKDSQKSLFSIWQDVFRVPRAKRKHLGGGEKVEGATGNTPEIPDVMDDNTTLKSRFYNILHVVQSFGDYEKVIQGVYENYLKVPFKDTNMKAVTMGLDRLCHSDTIMTEVHTTQNYSLMPFLNYTIVLFHFLFAAYNWPKLEYPHLGYEAFLKLSRTKNVLESVIGDTHPRLRRGTTIQNLAEEVLPFIVDIIQPSLRPVNAHLYTPQEKAELKKVVHIMLDFNLSYHQERQVDGQYLFVVEPNIEEAVRFPGQTRPQMPYSVKQLIAKEIEVERMRRERDGAVSEATAPSGATAKKTPQDIIPSYKRQKLEPKKITGNHEVTEVAKDFFGRPITKVAVENLKEPDVLSAPGIWYHFKEGYNNAVRKTIRMKDLL